MIARSTEFRRISPRSQTMRADRATKRLSYPGMEPGQSLAAVDMNDPVKELTEKYTAAIEDYLDRSQEVSAERARELGNLAVEAGLGTADIARIHARALDRILQNAAAPEVGVEIVKQAGEWLAQSLLPFDRQYRQQQNVQTRRCWKHPVIRESIPDLLYCTDIAGHLIRWNQQLEMVTGWDPADLKNKPVMELFDPEARCLVDECIREALSAGKAEVEAELMAMVGAIPYQFKMIVLKDPDDNDKVVGLASIGRNSIQLKMSAIALRESESRFRNVVENINEFFWLTNADGSETIYVSPAYEQMWGRSCESLYQQPRSFLDAIHPDDRDRVIDNLPIKHQHATDREYRIVKPDGTVRWIRDRAFPLRNETGEVYRIALIAEDITERQQQAAELEASVSLLRATLEATADGILVISKEGEIVDFNRKFVQMWNLPESILESTEDKWVVAFAIDLVKDPEDFLEGIDREYAQPETAHCQIVELKDGRLIERSSLPHKIGSKTIGRVLSFRDVTQQKQAEETLRKNNEELDRRVRERTAALMQANAQLRREISDRQQARDALETAKEQLQAVLDAVPGLVFWIRSDLRYIGANKNLAATFECLPEQFVDQPIGFLEVDAELAEFLYQFFATPVERTTREITIPSDGEDLSYLVVVQKYDRSQAAVAVGIDITERLQTEAQLRAVTSRLTALIENLQVGVLVKDESKQVVLANQGFCNIFGISVPPAALIGADFSEFARDYEDLFANPSRFWQRHRQIIAEKKAVMSEEFRLADGRAIAQDYAPIFVNGSYAGHLWMYRDISDRKQAEERIKASLEEKETLLKEIHHRVKNNLQIIISLLRLQSRTIRDSKIRELFEDSENRVRTMAKVHEQLYQSHSLAEIDFQDYITEVVAQLAKLYNGRQRGISFFVNARGISLDIETAIPCGLIINELVSNAFKYAFPHRRSGEICISLAELEEGRFILAISDNGVGLPENFDWHSLNSYQTQSLGLKLVHRLTKQLEGNMELERSQGTKFQLAFAKPRD